jgi:hypothetical protein
MVMLTEKGEEHIITAVIRQAFQSLFPVTAVFS